VNPKCVHHICANYYDRNRQVVGIQKKADEIVIRTELEEIKKSSHGLCMLGVGRLGQCRSGEGEGEI
jgi:hypothetical protein